MISLSYKINSVVGGEPLKLGRESREGSITFMNRKENDNDNNTGSAMRAIYNAADIFDDLMAIEESKEKKPTNEKEVDFMKKYLSEKWKIFFSENVVEKIKLYESKLCDEQKKDDLFDQFGSEEKDEDNGFEDLLGLNKKHKSRDDDFFGEGNDDEEEKDKENEINNEEDDWLGGSGRKSSHEHKYNEEVNIIEFDFVNEGSNDDIESPQKIIVDEVDNEKEDKLYNDANYWKNNNNEYINKIGEEAMKDLL